MNRLEFTATMLEKRIAKLAMPEILSYMGPYEKSALSEICRHVREKVEKALGSNIHPDTYENAIKLAIERLKEQGKIKEGVFERTFILPK